MTRFDVAVIALNMLGACAAACAAGWAAKTGDPRLRVVWSVIGAVATLYVAGYVWLLAIGDVQRWSQIFRGLSIVVWPLVWTMPPIVSARKYHQDTAHFEDVRAVVNERLRR